MSTFYKRFDLGNDKDDNVVFPEVLGHWRGSSDLEGWELPTPSVIGMMLNEVGRKLGIGKVYMTGYVIDVPDGAVGHLLYVGDTWSVNETQVFDSMEAEDRYHWSCLAKGWIPTSKPVLLISVRRLVHPPDPKNKSIEGS
ncbi:MAG: hypothetical protein M1830_010090 [Pleopsidium flavum]|nr:MAG: hypothetical protein M1830_010090 [Pleopsidium flavum]